MAHNYVVTANKPTIVTHSLVGNFTSATDFNLILCKSTRVEILAITEDGLQPLLDVGIYGRIATASLFRLKGENKDFLFLSTEKYKFCVLSYDAQTGQIVTRATGDITDRVGHATDVGQIAGIDPDCRLIGLHTRDGFYKVIPFDERGQLREPFNIKIEEMRVIDIKFLHGCKNPTIAMLYQDNKSARHLKTYEISIENKDLREGSWSKPNIERTAELIVAIPKPFGGVIVIGEQSIVYHSRQSTASLAMKTTLIKAAGLVDANGSRVLLGDQFGRLFCLILQNNGVEVTGLQLEFFGQTSAASTISYLDNGVLFVGSTFGDSQLVKLNSTKNPNTGQYIDILENFTNLGPIVDFCVVDAERQGQGQVVTCSGAFKDGSLRIIRNGIGINEHAQIELPGIKGVWSLNPPDGSQVEKYLIVSFVGETRVLAMAGEQLEETEIEGFKLDQQTLFCTNMANGHYLQITSKGLYLVHATTQRLVNTWLVSGDTSISVTSCNQYQVAVCTKGKDLTLLDVSGDEIKVVSTKTLPHEISCITLNPVGNAKNKATVCAVGLWTDISVRLLVLPTLEEVRKLDIGGDIIPRSLLLETFEDASYLLVALGDGHLITWGYDPNTGDISNKKKLSLGTQPVVLNRFVSSGKTNVFACSDRPTVIHQSTTAKKQLLYANVNLKEVNYMCDFDCPSFRGSLALATENALTIGSVDEIQKLHIRTVPLSEMPRRISHAESYKNYCLLTVRFELDPKGDEIDTNFIKLIDDQTFEVNDSYTLQRYETACSVITTKFSNDPVDYIVVGTAFAPPDLQEPTEGRILVFSVTDNKFRLQNEITVKGAVYSFCDLQGKLVAGINSKVQLFTWEPSEGGHVLKFKTEHRGNVVALFLATRGDFIVVGDLMKSISLLMYTTAEGIKEIARDYHPNWITAVDILDDDNFVGAENSFNLFSVRKNSEAVTDEERGRLEVSGEYHLGEFINRFRHGSLVMKMPDGEGLNLQTLVWASVSGAIGILATIPPEMFAIFDTLQTAMRRIVKSVGGLSHEEWRQFSNERKTANAHGFIDGDLIESFLELSPELMQQVAQAANSSVEELTKHVETITRALH